MEREELQNMRVTYLKGTLDRENLNPDPLAMSKTWLQVAVDQEIFEANAMSLATVDEDKQPSLRTVLLKEIDDAGFIFYSNYHSRKGREIKHNPKASILLFWKKLERQIRIEGKIEKISEQDSKAYFKSRPKGSQLGAWASPQSKVITGRAELDDRLQELQDIYKEQERLPKPAHWGGYRLVPHYYEFWQGRDNRLHDRFEYKLKNDGWTINRLAP